MKLQDLRIRLTTYGPNEGKYVGTVEFADETGKVELVLDPEVSNRVLEVLADRIVDLTAKPAKTIEASMRQSIVEAKNAPTLTA